MGTPAEKRPLHTIRAQRPLAVHLTGMAKNLTTVTTDTEIRRLLRETSFVSSVCTWRHFQLDQALATRTICKYRLQSIFGLHGPSHVKIWMWCLLHWHRNTPSLNFSGYSLCPALHFGCPQLCSLQHNFDVLLTQHPRSRQRSSQTFLRSMVYPLCRSLQL